MKFVRTINCFFGNSTHYRYFAISSDKKNKCIYIVCRMNSKILLWII
jgi:hypothetical protein